MGWHVFNRIVNETTIMVHGNKKGTGSNITYSWWIRCSHGVILFLESVTIIVNPYTLSVGQYSLLRYHSVA